MTARSRRTQAERTAHTQHALLEATIECLAEVGYAGTTTREVAERAGVSRGAQTHHYATKADLVVAAVEHLFAVQAEGFRDRFGELPAERRTLPTAVDLLWEIAHGSSYAALLEVIVAGRTDPYLRVVVHGVTARLEQTVVDLLRQFLPEFDQRVARTLIDLGFTLVQGAAVSSYSGYGNPDHTIRLVRAAAGLVTPDTATLLKGALDVLDT